jgi:hypothetical protein
VSNPEEIRQLGLSVGNAINVTAALAAAQTDQDPVEYFISNVETVTHVVIDLQARKRAEAGLGAIVVDQQTVPAPTQAYVPPSAPASNVVPFQPGAQQFQPAAPAPAPAPAPIPNVSNGTDPQLEAEWTAFFNAVNAGQVAQNFQQARQGQWFDNRAGKSAQAPDFKVKGQRGEQTPALWANDKKNPAWVAQGLRQVGLA